MSNQLKWEDMKFSTLTLLFNCGGDRYMLGGFRGETTFEERLDVISKIGGVTGVQYIMYPDQINDKNVDHIKSLLKSHKLHPVSVAPNLAFDRKWKYGSISALNEKTRKDAVQLFKTTIDICAELGADAVHFWPGQDGYDYFFQIDYRNAWDNFINSMREIAEYRPEVRIQIEYKTFEPRSHIFLSTLDRALRVCEKVGSKNMGIVWDPGHANLQYEGWGESVMHMARENRLDHLDLNDSMGGYDDDRVVGSVNFWQTLELFYWLKEVGYRGWYGLHPERRMDPTEWIKKSLKNIQMIIKLLNKINREEMQQLINDPDAGILGMDIFLQLLSKE